jgi:flavin reductase (DIM6/NTAB) family NADH-FMN oxidoreductase RutF
MWKDWVRPLVRPLPQWSTIAVAPSQQAVVATLRWNGGTADVTADHAVASLKPLMIVTSIDAGPSAVIEYRDRGTGDLLGVLQLAKTTQLAIEQTPLTLYRVEAGEHRCLRWPHRPWNTWLQNRLMRKNPSAQHALMTPQAVQQLMIAYLCPRPVVLVSVQAAGHQNIFPMDLIGPLERSGFYSLALRSTNVSAPFMRQTQRVALSSMPAGMKTAVYALSAHHKQPLDNWNAVPFPVRPSREFDIPSVAEALRVHELNIVHSQEFGSHTLFVGRIASTEEHREGMQLHHTPGYYQAYRRRQAMAFAEV